MAADTATIPSPHAAPPAGSSTVHFKQRRAPEQPFPEATLFLTKNENPGRIFSDGSSKAAGAPCCFLGCNKPLVFSCASSNRRAWWRAPVVPATREAEAGGSLEPRSSGLYSGIAPVNSHCTPAWAT
uniref:Uncharacterized protein n=1 Tax=Monodon monoceros TaxID=40151 RepID=A0A8C6BQ76_MONMO